MVSIQKTTWDKEWERELKFWFSDEGKEMQYCLVAQGYTVGLFGRLMTIVGSGFTALEIIKEIEKEVF